MIASLLFLAACEPDPDLPTEGQLHVLTYNVAGLPDGLSGADGPLQERMAAIAPMLSDYDLVGLQEDFTPDGHATLVSEADQPIAHWFDAKVETDRAYGSGLAQLARGQQLEYAEEHYDGCNGVLDGASDCLASKGFQVLTLSLGGYPLAFYNTHHEAGGGDEDEAVRLAQVQQVIDSMDGRSAGQAILYVGDMNLHPDDEADAAPLQLYADAGLRRACVELDCPEPNHIDQLRIRDSAELELWVESWSREEQFVTGDGTDLSDHPAIAATFGWRVVGSQ